MPFNTLSNALLFLILSGLNAAWKAPVAYFLTHTLTAITQKELVEHILCQLEENGFVVDCLTLDGHATNLAMCRLLGAELSNPFHFKSWFSTPLNNYKVNVLLDPCHMIKLVRNMLHAFGGFKSPDGLVEWRYIDQLLKVQEETGWRLGNKLTCRHVNFHQNKMKVSW